MFEDSGRTVKCSSSAAQEILLLQGLVSRTRGLRGLVVRLGASGVRRTSGRGSRLLGGPSSSGCWSVFTSDEPDSLNRMGRGASES